MGKCYTNSTYCVNGCCNNVTIHCCNITCSSKTYCKEKDDDGGSILGSIFGFFAVAFLIAVGIIILKSVFKVGKDCLRDVCSDACDCVRRCIDGVSCDCLENVDCDECLKCISCVCLSPCLFLNWLRREWKERTSQQDQEPQITDTPVVTDLPAEGRGHPIQQTNINISIHNEPRHRSGSVSSSSDDSTFSDPPSPPIYSITTNMQFPRDRYEPGGTRHPVDGSVPPPSYHEATKDDPPSYFEAHNYPVNEH